MAALIVVLAVVVVLALWAVGVYNGLVTLRNRGDGAWADIDVQLRRRHDRLEVATATARTWIVALGRRQVPKLARQAVRPAQDAPAAHDRGPDPGRDRQVDELAASTGGAEGLFAERRDHRVPVESDRQAGRACHPRREVEAGEPVVKREDRVDEHAGPGEERPGPGDPDALQRRADLARDPASHDLDAAEDSPDDGIGALLGTCRHDLAGEDRAIRSDDGAAQAAAAEVDRQHGPGMLSSAAGGVHGSDY